MWSSAVINHMNAGLPIRFDWAFHARVKDLSTNALVNKGIWTGDYDYSITLDSLARTYQGAAGGINLDPPSARIGTFIMRQQLQIALSSEGLDIIQQYNTRNAQCDIFCLAFDARDRAYLGYYRTFKGFVDLTEMSRGPVSDIEADVLSAELVSIAKKGAMTTTGKKSNQSLHDRNVNDDFYKYASLGTKASDPWATTDD